MYNTDISEYHVASYLSNSTAIPCHVDKTHKNTGAQYLLWVVSEFQ